MKLARKLRRTALLILLVYLLNTSVTPPGDQLGRARAFTLSREFDYVAWTFDALAVKLGQEALGSSRYLDPELRSQTVLDYLALLRELWRVKAAILEVYSDPNVVDPVADTASMKAELDALNARRSNIEPLAEAILQDQTSRVVADLGLTLGGQPLPPVLYHTTPPPYSLIISPRDVIRRDHDLSLSPQLTVDEMVILEDQIDRSLDVSSLVVGIGGIGLYPTMVMETADINWLSEVVAHEWVHNYLTLRPLGVNYLTSPELRTMNETAASIAGKEIGLEVIARYYPQFLPQPQAAQIPAGEQETAQGPVFDFRAEMRQTRVTVDQMLAAGKIAEAEEYMEARQRVFWENGYHIRKINQAYFAFYGAYADQPGGAAGEDPVGAAVRDLRAQSPSLAVFLNQISWMWSFEQLQRAVEEPAP
ncbi:MAG: hypothetical protein JW726_00610 [Anaerolineales bacterium]|nr:hypothetical protein [Anaerolineales bacterium]